MSRNNRSGRNHRQNKNRSNAEREEGIIDSPVVACFREYAKELDDKHDRYERIVKISRDITIESKRVIFLLHTIDHRINNRETVLEEAKKRLQTVIETQFIQIARELNDLDQNQYCRAFSAGLQEFIEAYSFYEYSKGNLKLSDWEVIQDCFKYNVDMPPQSVASDATDEKPTQEEVAVKKEIVCWIKPIEFMLGLSDLGGEIMRRCINCLGGGDIDSCFQACRTLQALYAGYLSNGPTGNREMSRKIVTLRQSTLKAENVCYNIKVRGKEAIPYDALETGFVADKMNHEEDDEGFF